MKRTRRDDWIARMARVERGYRAAASARVLLEERIRMDPNFGEPYGWRPSDAQRMGLRLEDTYVVRLYAEFEAGLRDVWLKYHRRRTRPAMEQLVARIAALHIVPPDWLGEADELRRYRNALVHDEGEGTADMLDPIAPGGRLAEATRRLRRFFSRLPADW